MIFRNAGDNSNVTEKIDSLKLTKTSMNRGKGKDNMNEKNYLKAA